MMKPCCIKKFTALLMVLLMMASHVVIMTSCSPGPPPALEDVYDRLVEVIEGAHKVNTALFGVGLPVYSREGKESAFNQTYFNVPDDGMEYVSEYSRYRTVAEIRAAVEQVYGRDYRESLFESVFTGYAYAEGGDSVLPARYNEKEGMMYQSRYVKPLVYGQRTYDYASMEIISGHATYIEVSIRSYAGDKPGEWITGDLGFVYENGNWYLDGPSC